MVRAVETGAAAAVVCERKAQPPQLTRLLVPLCRARAVPLLALNDLSRHVGAKLGLPRCLTLALKVSSTGRHRNGVRLGPKFELNDDHSKTTYAVLKWNIESSKKKKKNVIGFLESSS